MFVGLVIACLVLGVSGDPQIVGGKNATVRYPYQVSLKYQGSHICGGAIIGSRFILTAAHCLVIPSPFYISVVVGSNNRSQGIEYPLETFFVHEHYNSTIYRNDIGLIRVSKEIKFNKDVQPIDLPVSDRNYDNIPLLATGWGLLSAAGPVPDQLQEILVKGLSQQRCADIYKQNKISIVRIENTMLCTFTQTGQGMCNGDSGGPLVFNNTLVGLVSFGVPCAQGIPDVFTRVYQFKSWINETTKQEKSNKKPNNASISQFSIILYCLMYLCTQLYK